MVLQGVRAGSAKLAIVRVIICAVVALLYLFLPAGLNAQSFDLSGVDIGSDAEGVGLSFVMRSANRAAFSYIRASDNSLRYGELSPSSSLSSSTVVASLSTSSRTALALLYDKPHIIYHDSSLGRLMHAFQNGSSWITEIIDSSANAGGDPAAITCGDYICISYRDNGLGNLRFVKGRSGAWSPVTVDSSSNDVGAMSSITLDSSGYPAIAYYDSSAKLPKVARQGGSGSWTIESLSYYTHQFGMWPSIAIGTDGTTHLTFASTKVDDLNGSDTMLWYAKKPASGSWTISNLEWSHVAGYTSLRLDSSQRPLIAYRYHRNDIVNQLDSAVFFRKLNSSGTWDWDKMRGGNSAFHSITNIGLSSNYWGDTVIGYHFERDSFGEDPAFSAIRIHGPLDSDIDGVPDARESSFGTNSQVADTDGDGLLDGYEALVLGSNPLATNTDGDSFTDSIDPDPLRSDDGNLVRDGSMESPQLDSWTPYGFPTTYQKSTIQIYQGAKSLRLKGTAGTAGAEQQEIATATSTVYEVTLRYRRLSGTTTIRVGWGNSQTDISGTPLTDSNSSSWQYLQRQVTSPGSAGDLRIVALTDGELFLDDVLVTIVSGTGDMDEDGVADSIDNCPTTYNPTQLDSDSDTIGDACDSTPFGSSSSSSGSSSSSQTSSSSSSTSSSSSSSSTSSSSSSTSSSSSPSSSSSSASSSSNAGPDTDGDGTPDSSDNDDDNDGLSDTQEANAGTNPLVGDSDNDGVLDGQEIIDGTNPLDRGSNLPVRPAEICGEWNGFLGGMYNIMEHVNTGSADATVHTILYDQNGNPTDSVSFAVGAGAEFDLLVHDLSGRQANSYGKVCSSHGGDEGQLDGRMVYYKTRSSPSNQSEEFEFALAMPLENGRRGSQFLPFNTYQPSLDPNDATNLVANWIAVTNTESVVTTGQLIFYDQGGEELGRHSVTLQPGARADYAGHAFGPQHVGLVEWRPANEQASVQLRNIRYLFDNEGNQDSFDTAFQLEGSYGSGEVLTSPLDPTVGSAILEVSNTLSSPVSVTVQIFNEAGNLKNTTGFVLGAHASRHLIADEYLSGERGIAIVRGWALSSIVTTSMHYSRTPTGGIQYMYGLAAKQALGSVLTGSYNTFLGQHSRLLLLNPGAYDQTLSLAMTRSDGSEVTNDGRTGVPVAVLLGSDVAIPGHGMRIIDLNDYDLPNNYGVVSVLPVNQNQVIAWVVRVRGDDYAIPTPVRQ